MKRLVLLSLITAIILSSVVITNANGDTVNEGDYFIDTRGDIYEVKALTDDGFFQSDCVTCDKPKVQNFDSTIDKYSELPYTHVSDIESGLQAINPGATVSPLGSGDEQFYVVSKNGKDSYLKLNDDGFLKESDPGELGGAAEASEESEVFTLGTITVTAEKDDTEDKEWEGADSIIAEWYNGPEESGSAGELDIDYDAETGKYTFNEDTQLPNGDSYAVIDQGTTLTMDEFTEILNLLNIDEEEKKNAINNLQAIGGGESGITQSNSDSEKKETSDYGNKHDDKTNYDIRGVKGIDTREDGTLTINGESYRIENGVIRDSNDDKVEEEDLLEDMGKYTIVKDNGERITRIQGHEDRFYDAGTLASRGGKKDKRYTEVATPKGWKAVDPDNPVENDADASYGMTEDGKGFYCDGKECNLNDGARVNLKDDGDKATSYTVAGNHLWTKNEDDEYVNPTGTTKAGSWGDHPDCTHMEECNDCTTGYYHEDAGCTTKQGAQDFETWSHDINGLLEEATTWASYGAAISNLFLGNDAWEEYKDWQTKFFENNAFGQLLMGEFEEALGICTVDFKDEVDSSQTVMVDIGGDLNQYGIHVEGEKTPVDSAYIYKVSFYVYNNYDEEPEEEINYWNIFFYNGSKKLPYYNEWQNISEESAYAGTGSNMIVQPSNKTYDKVCLELQKPLTDYEGEEQDEVCNVFTLYEGAATPYDTRKEKKEKVQGGSGSGKVNENI